ncbi:MAG TPA: FAD-dependent oxidoreductase, partial [Syntrophothermus lipocalidus]|nr:FAD-dependent oxidoreductase [Syntrophothermus lipocalidus]
AARVAATRGHDVTLWEKEVNLGGQLELAAAIPGRQDFVHLIDYLEDSLVELAVKVETQKEADIGEIKRFGPDAVVIATGARPIMPDIPGIDSKNVVGAWEVLAFEPELGKRVVIIGGGAVGCEVALFIARMGTIDADTVKFLLLNEAEPVERIRELAQRGTKEVVVVEQDKNMGRGIGISTRWIILQELARMGVQLRPSTKVIAIEEDGVVVSDPQGRTEKIPADAVVVAVGSKPANSLYEEIKQAFPETYLIGDAKEPRKALEAVHEGFDVGNAI